MDIFWRTVGDSQAILLATVEGCSVVQRLLEIPHKSSFPEEFGNAYT